MTVADLVKKIIELKEASYDMGYRESCSEILDFINRKEKERLERIKIEVQKAYDACCW